MEKIPVKKLVFSEEKGKSGVKTIAFVDQPAIMVNWIAFRDEAKPVAFAIQNEERRIIFSPALIPDLHIPRIDPITKLPFVVTMDRDTIMQVALNWQKEGRQNFANEMHDGKQVKGITWFNAVVTDEMMFPNPKPWENLPIGTLFMAGKVDNNDIWNKVKDGTYQGISIEGFFDMVDLGDADIQQIEAMTEDILN